MDHSIWQQCLDRLQGELPEEQFNMWLRPLQTNVSASQLQLLAPNSFVMERIKADYYSQIESLLREFSPNKPLVLSLVVGSKEKQSSRPQASSDEGKPKHYNYSGAHTLNTNLTVENFIIGESNRLAYAAAKQVAQNPGVAYNPLFIYGDVGLGKTHLMHAVGNVIKQNKPDANILYLRSERFVTNMVKALQHNKMTEFKRFFRSADALLIDDIQFLAGKDRSQEEFFHTFNALLDGGQQIVLACDKYPKEINGLEERLKSRFGWGLTVGIDPPELETRVAILLAKAEQANPKVMLPDEVAFFIAKHIRSNVRELEGALRRVIANAHFTGESITLDFARDALKDLLAVQTKLVSVDNIQKTVSEYYKIKRADLLSKKRTRFIARARQLAMALTKELTHHSLPEIGDAFGGRDHTTVMHACKKIKELVKTNVDIKEDYVNLLRTLST